MTEARDDRIFTDRTGERRISGTYQVQDKTERLSDRIGHHHADKPGDCGERAMPIKVAEAREQAQPGGDHRLP